MIVYIDLMRDLNLYILRSMRWRAEKPYSELTFSAIIDILEYFSLRC